MSQSNSLHPVKLRGVEIYAAESADSLIEHAVARKGILIAVNAEKMAKASKELIELINANIGYCDGSGVVLAAEQKGVDSTIKIAGCEL